MKFPQKKNDSVKAERKKRKTNENCLQSNKCDDTQAKGLQVREKHVRKNNNNPLKLLCRTSVRQKKNRLEMICVRLKL